MYRFQMKILKDNKRKHTEHKDFALSNMTSTSKLTECMDICIDIPFTCEDFLLEERGGAVGLILSAIATVIRGLRLLISIP